jgi:NADPH-dependent glutamate synthase beta subunit-like oxidoreductase
VVTGAATVISAMGGGRKAAKSMHAALSGVNQGNP